MTALKWLGGLLLLLFGWGIVFLFSNESNVMPLGGNYYTTGVYSEMELHWCADPDKPASGLLLERVNHLQRNSQYLVAEDVRTGNYFAFPLHVSFAQEASAKRRGPFSESKLKAALRRLSSDTVFHSVGWFTE